MGRRGRRDAPGGPCGLLLVDKPQGPTSFDVVARVRRALQVRRVGHTGTLDPMATGLLPVLVGPATRLVPFLTEGDKAYEAVLRLGVGTDSLDAEGEVIARDDPAAVAAVDAAAFEAALASQRGALAQRAPIFSAIKVDGERLYAKARRGEQVEAPVRPVTVHRLELLEATPPDYRVAVRCSKGTYVRALARDVAAHLGLHAHLVALRRTEVGALRVQDAVPLDALEQDAAAARAALRPMIEALGHLPRVVADADAVRALGMGQRRAFPDAPPGRCVVVDGQGRLVAIVTADGATPALIERGFPAGSA
ncbi:MAG: tRNA pseudouridine(55) synthase TruB [Myxococcales bacterium]|nr:tRNA pseudouridine(55) synthase TruB [Myxococcales bacterium]